MVNTSTDFAEETEYFDSALGDTPRTDSSRTSACSAKGNCHQQFLQAPSSPTGTLTTDTLSSSSLNGESTFDCSLDKGVFLTPSISPPSSPTSFTFPSVVEKVKDPFRMIIHNQDRSKFQLNRSASATESIDEKASTSYKSNGANTSSEGPKSNSMTAASTMRPGFNTKSNGTRVWVKRSAVEAAKNPRLSFKERISRKPSSFTNGGSSFSGSMSIASAPYGRQTSFTSSIGGGSVASFATQRDPFGESDSDISMGQGSMRSNEQWGWTSACMIDNSDGKITLRLDEVPLNSAASDTSSASVLSSSSSNNSNDQIVKMPGAAFRTGDIVMANEYEMSNTGNPICPDDLISLSHLHEPAVVECLQNRYEDNRIYTATGPVLLALNPFKGIDGLYGESSMKLYWEKAENQSVEELPPHVYAIADEAFRNMMRSLEQTLGTKDEGKSCDQSILVSGESGAGKTVTTKFVMKYLAALSQRAGNQPKEKRAYEKVADEKKKETKAKSGRSSATRYVPPNTSFLPPPTASSSGPPSWVKRSKSSNSDNNGTRTKNGADGLSNVTNLVGNKANNSIEAQVLQSNPILESFGNARTIRNDNSSRFGKFIEIQFTTTGRLVGANIETYLLEKVRLVTQSLGERNYHIFYEMLSGAMGADELRNYFIASTASPDDFKITASGTLDRRDGVSDRDTCRDLQAAMNTMKFTIEEQRYVFATAAAILHASNLTFCDFDQYCQLDGHNVHLEPVCHLLGVTAEDLNQALCHCSITAGRETQVQQNLDVDKAEKGLEALIKSTYGALFAFLVSRINDSICYSPDSESKEAPSASIGLLDIFGFESFKTNSFEQLCINYCNEALQQQFNAFVLKNEQAEYEREGIEWSFIEFPENQDVIDLIDKRGSGILCILDDQCRAPGTSDRSFALDIFNKCKSHVRFSANRKQTALLQFCVNHYAGPVEYTSYGFIEKNRDELPKEATELLQNSFNPFIRMLSGMMENLSAERSAGANKSSRANTTVGGQFRRQLKRLREKIDVMSPHYVRCLKPNDQLIPDHFHRAAVAEQLSCGGILEAVRVARAGYSNHYSHEDFVRRYRCLGWDALKASKRKESSMGSPQPKKKFFAGAVPTPSSESPTKGRNSLPTSPNSILTASSCKTLVQHLCRLLKEDQKDEDNDENEKNSANTASDVTSSWKITDSKNAGGTTSESARVGIQIGKSKVFLRHKAFESLERMRSQQQSRAAVKLNSVFRMYLARVAFVDVRNAVRKSMYDLQALQSGDWDETKDDNSDDGRLVEFFHKLNQMRGQGISLVEAWAQQMRGSIHNPVPRSEWGRTGTLKPFRWMLVDGLWIKNHDLGDESV